MSDVKWYLKYAALGAAGGAIFMVALLALGVSEELLVALIVFDLGVAVGLLAWLMLHQPSRRNGQR